MGEDAAIERFAEEVARGEGLDLGRAALLAGLYDRPDLDVERSLAGLDDVARTIRERQLPALEAIRALFGEDGFRGNEAEYYDPRNSLLHHVLERRLGIPITLSIVAMEVGRRLGLQVEGVPFPGHFLVRLRDAGQGQLLDAFNGGEPLSDAALLARLQALTGRIGSLGPRELGAAGKRQILARMLQNLKGIHVRADRHAAALEVQERLLVLDPSDPVERRDRGLMRARLGMFEEAEADLEFYLAADAGAQDADNVRKLTEHLRGRRGPVH